MLSTSSSTLWTTGKHSVGQHVHKQILALEKSVTVIVHRQLQHLSTPCTNPIRIGRMTMKRTPEYITDNAIQNGPAPLKLFSKAVLNSDTPYSAKNVTMTPIKEMPKVTQVCLYETLISLLSHDMQEFEVDSLFLAAGPNVQTPKHGVSTSAG
jgi:hypothetical protein